MRLGGKTVEVGAMTKFADGQKRAVEGFKGKVKRFSAGKNCVFGEGVRIRCEEFICGDGCTFHDRTTIFGRKVVIGNGLWVGQDCILDGTGTLSIGDGVAIGAGTYVFTHVGRFGKVDLASPVSIGDGAWLLPRVFVNPGVKIGAHSRIDNCSLVTKDVPPYSIARGVPAVFVREFRE